MKINKFTSALIGLGIISAASTALAVTPPVIYLTGSTAARGNIFTAATTPGEIFLATSSTPAAPSNPTIVSNGNSGANNVSGASQIAYEGYINVGGTPTLVDLDFSFTGSEAGIASVAGQNLTQVLPNDPNGTPGVTAWPLPGVGSSATFLTQSSSYVTAQALPIAGGVSTPDLTMADTSQAVSFTSVNSFPLKDYGTVGVVPFTWMKGYEATPDAAWNHLSNVTVAQLNQVLSGLQPAGFFTGTNADSALDSVVVIGRNLGSGTRANTLLTTFYGVTTPVDQWGYNWSYPSSPSSAEGTLTFSGAFTPNGNGLSEIGNDGYDSGKFVQQTLNVDGTGQGGLLIGYVGMSDAANAASHSAGGGSAAYLSFNGVYESDNNVAIGTYEFWGQEHLLGHNSPSTTTGDVGTAVAAGIKAELAAQATKTGDVTTQAQNALISLPLMQVKRGADNGFPQVGTFN